MKTRLSENKTFAQISLVIITAIWGITFIMVKEALNDAPPYAFAGWRFLIASFCNLLFIITQLNKFTKLEVIGGMFCGILLHFGYAFQNYGLQLTTASKSAFITGTSILIVPFILWVYLKKTISLKTWLAIMIALVGLFLLINPSEGNLNFGDIITIGCSVSFAGHIIVQDKYIKQNISIFRFFFIQLVTVTILSFLSYAIIDSPSIIWSSRLINALLITGVFATFIAIGVMVWAQRILTPTQTALIFILEPVFAALYSWYAVGEILTITGMLGGFLIIVGVIIAETTE
ncbi:MAG: DMT family transporter [Candidatus Marinimicrobia bacterium]|nr:DMT family transporter [Candidatus Neomarinimicrobiota bacterium]